MAAITGERSTRGRDERAAVPRSVHGEWAPAADRPDPVDLLAEQDATRVPELVPVRYGRMLVSPFTFFRGAASVMASDLAAGPRTGLHAQLCGDAHLSNFGVFAAPDRRLVFSVNDFDETLPGPFEWDVKRLVASFAVAGRDRGFDDEERASVNRTVARSYRDAMRSYAEMRTLDVWYSRVEVEEATREWAAQAGEKQRRRFERNVAKARAKDSLTAFDKLTHLVDGQPRIVSDPPLIVPIGELLAAHPEQTAQEELVHSVLGAYRDSLPGDRRHLLNQFRYADAAHKVVGVGSVGARAWIVLLLGRDEGDPLFLQLKEAGPSVLEPFLGEHRYDTHGERVVEGQRLMQAASDVMLGWVRAAGLDGVTRDFYVRQLWDGKGSAIVEMMDPVTMTAYGKACGRTLARAHARSGDVAGIASYLGRGDVFDRAMVSFAEAYADQNERDFDAVREAVEAGRVAVATGL
jgi:uncharacterized protein (DUF2252 family)